MRSTRGRGGDDVPTSLFGLDDVPRQAKKKKRNEPLRTQTGKKTADEEPSEERLCLLDAVQPGLLAGEASRQMTPKLSKAQWLSVRQVRMIGHWSDQHIVDSFKIEPPTAADPYYFWIHWDTALGRKGLDKCGWQVSDLNKHLMNGKLQFKCDHHQVFTTSFHDGEGVHMSGSKLRNLHPCLLILLHSSSHACCAGVM